MDNWEWSCPYCEVTGTTRWNKSSHYDLHDHIAEHHLDKACEYIIQSLLPHHKHWLFKHYFWHYNYFTRDYIKPLRPIEEVVHEKSKD